MPVTAQIAVNAVPGSNDNVPLNVSVALSNVDNTGVTTWEWALLTQPTEGVGPSASLSSTSAAAPTFTPNREGSYLIRLIVNKDLVDEASDIIVVAVRELETGNRVPAIMETTENNGATGWAGTAVNDILRRVTRLTDGGTFVCIADVALSPGDVVHMSGLTTIAAGLPGERKIPTVNKALATSLANVDGPLGVMAGNKDGQFLAVAPGDYCRVMVIGAIPAFTLASGGSAGDPVYVDNTGALSLSPGFFIRQVGDVARVIVDGTYDLAIAAVSNSIPRGNAGGDLSGEYPNPEVAKLKGTTLNTSTEIPGHVLQLATATTAGWGPVDLANTSATTGLLRYSAISTQLVSAPFVGIINIALPSYYTMTTATITAGAGPISFNIQALNNADPLVNFVTASSNNTGAILYLRYIITGPSGYSKTMIHQFYTSISHNTNQIVGSITFPTGSVMAPTAGSYTIAAAVAITAGCTWTIYSPNLVVWQG